MKRLIIFCAVAALLSACEKNDDFNTLVSSETLYEFNDRFPDARGVSWEKRGIYKVAIFKSGGEKMTAWYQQDGSWCMTEKRMEASSAPLQVRNSYKIGTAVSEPVEYVDHLIREGIEDMYVAVSGEGSSTAEYYFSVDGLLIKTVESETRIYDDYRNEIVPQVPEKVYKTIGSLYSSARIMEVDVVFPGVLYVDIIDNMTLKTMEFALTGSWSRTYWDVSEEYVKGQYPDVYDAYKAQEYNNSCSITSIQCFHTPTSLYYWFHLDINGSEANLKVNQNGDVIALS